MEIFPQWDQIQYGESVSFVCQLLVKSPDKLLVVSLDRPCRKVFIKGQLPDNGSTTWCLLDAKVIDVKPMTLEIGGATSLFPVPSCGRSKLNQVIELCCGIGAFSSVCAPLGFKVLAGVDFNAKWASLFASCHSGQPQFLQGECGDLNVVRQLLALGGMHSLVLSGISCQPFSVGGDRKGLSDPRSISLPHTLRTAWLLQAPVIVLECTPEIQKDEMVQAMLLRFKEATGCFLTQSLVALQDIWCTKRERWFAIFSAGPIGPIVIPPPPALRDFQVVGDVMPYVVSWPAEDLAQLELSLYELSRFYSFAASGIQKAFLDLKAQLPTLLHSCGNQLYDCQCGCRKALSPERISARGLFGTLIPFGEVVYHEFQHLQKARYFHPKEMFLLQGGSPAVDFGPNHRLAMAGIGQCVSPMIATWILAQIRSAIQTFVNEPVSCPKDALEEHLFSVLDARDELWPTPMNRADFLADEHPVRVWDHGTSSMIEFKCAPSVKIENFLTAELALARFLGEAASSSLGDAPAIWAGEQQCHCLESRLHSLNDLSIGKISRPEPAPLLACPCLDFCDSSLNPLRDLSPTIPFEVVSQAPVPAPKVDCMDLAAKPSTSLLAVQCPRLSSIASVPTLLQRVLPKELRLQIISNQAEIWADDEIRFNLHQLVEAGPQNQHVMLWDPLALTSVVRFTNFNLLHELVAGVPSVATVVSACLIEGHWYAICWRCQADSVFAYTCGHPCNMSVALQRVHQEFCVNRGCPVVPISFQTLPFVVDSCCGALAVAFLRHLIFAVDLPPSKQALLDFHVMLREGFCNSLAVTVPRPWIWGLGDESFKHRLGLLLQEHGVASDDVADRIVFVVSKLGAAKVEQALATGAPWKNLKALANASVPPLQLIRPRELELAIARRVSNGHPVGNRSQKTKGKGKGKAVPSVVDPSGLRIEDGIFQCGDGLSLHQVDLTTVGSQVSGIVLTTLAAALPYLKGGRHISAGGLGFLVVDCVATQVPTTLIPEPIRVPAVCVANSEPVLLDAVLFQLGALPVSRKSKLDACSIVTLSSCVIKILAFKDQLDVDWDSFVRHPMKHLFQKLPILQACDEEMCQGHCEAWHPTSECTLDNPLMELWGKQWLTLNFGQIPSSQAELFSVHVRIPAVLANQILTYSGVSGVYLEPKHVDGKQPSDACQVFWLQRHSYQEVLHIKQTTPNVLGIARVASKYGVRCKASCAEAVHGCLRPGGSFLPPGKKLHFMLGPLPFGTLRASLVKLLESIAWVARPLQPMTAVAHVNGVMWKIQSVVPPPVSTVTTDKGDVLITKLDDPKPQVVTPVPIVAANHTMDLCTGVVSNPAKQIDPLQLHDPWAVGTRLGVALPSVDPVQELEKRVLDSVMAKMPRDSMEVDGSPAMDASASRVTVLKN